MNRPHESEELRIIEEIPNDDHAEDFNDQVVIAVQNNENPVIELEEEEEQKQP